MVREVSLRRICSLTPAAQAFHSNFQAVRPISQGVNFPPDMLQGHGLQTLHLSAGLALEMRVGRVMLTGQFVVSRGSL
jgi:hypothetical protein